MSRNTTGGVLYLDEDPAELLLKPVPKAVTAHVRWHGPVPVKAPPIEVIARPYEWRTDWRPLRPLRPAQLACLTRIFELNGYCGVFGEMRTGKSALTLAYAVESGAERIVVVCPSVPMTVWRDEAEILGCPFEVVVLNQDRVEDRAKELQRLIKEDFKGLIVVNYESTISVTYSRWETDPKTKRRRKVQHIAPRLSKLLRRFRPDLLIFDEVQKLKHRASAQARAAHQLALLPSVRGRLGLSGTPITNGLEDLFSIYLFISPDVYGRSWSAHEKTYLKLGGFDGHQIVGYQNVERARALLHANACFMYQADAFAVQPPQEDPYGVYLTEPSARRYIQLRKDTVAQIRGTDPHGRQTEAEVVAGLRIVQLMKLHELAGGHVKATDDVDQPVEIDVSSEKIDAAVELASKAIDAGEPVVLACHFRREVERVRARLEALYPGKVGALKGGGSLRRKEATKTAFQRGALRVLVCQLKVASLGIDLTAAHIVVVVSTGWSFEDFAQFHDRTVGPNQTQPCTYYYLQARLPDDQPTVDRTIYRALSGHQNIARRMVDMQYALRLVTGE